MMFPQGRYAEAFAKEDANAQEKMQAHKGKSTQG